MPKGSIQKSTDLVLTNAIYFKGDWKDSFNKSETRGEDFHPADGEPVKHDFMHRKGPYPYAEDDNVQALRLPYKGGELAMTVLLPKPGKKLELTPAALSLLERQLNHEEVIVSLPKFRLEHEERLEHLLPKMGMKLAFTPQADFSGMRELKPDDKLYISVVIHKAFVDVDETGTEAAAATGVGMVFASAVMAPRPVKIFKADHPFLFLIEHLPTKTMLFLGKVSQP
jgi:serpin B